MTQLDEEATAIYDRQIRIWGLDVQRRLAEASILVLGCSPLAAEVCKNVVLAGVGAVALIDDTPAERLPTTFLQMHGVVTGGMSAASVFAEGLAAMNPMVKVTMLPGSANAVPVESDLKQHNIVVAFGLHSGQQDTLNDACRAAGIGLITAVSQGPTAYAFVDLICHQFYENAIKEDSSEAAKQQTLSYTSLNRAIATPLGKLSRQEQRQLNRFAGAWVALTRFEVVHKRHAVGSDYEALCIAGSKLCEGQGLSSRFWDGSALREFLNARPKGDEVGVDATIAGYAAELAPVNAVMGGFLANDVVRIVSRVGRPTHNVLFFSMSNSIAQVHCFIGNNGHSNQGVTRHNADQSKCA